MKYLILFFLRKIKPGFTFDTNLNGFEVFVFFYRHLICVLRGTLINIIFYRRFEILSLGKNVVILFKNRVFFGKNNRIGSNVILSGLGNKGLILGSNVSIADFSRIEVSQTISSIGDFIKIGDNVGISSFAGIGGSGGVTIGDDCIIGQYFSCHPENHIFSDCEKVIRLQGVSKIGIKIGKNVWIGAKVTMLDGSVVGNNCVIAAGAVVRGVFPDNCVLGGVPARILKEI